MSETPTGPTPGDTGPTPGDPTGQATEPTGAGHPEPLSTEDPPTDVAEQTPDEELPQHVRVQAATALLSGSTSPLQDEAAPYPDGRRRILIQPGDSLESLAGREGVNVADVYSLNSRALEDAAQARGFAGSDNGRVVFPGTVLVLP